jgi:hypothetical protein
MESIKQYKIESNNKADVYVISHNEQQALTLYYNSFYVERNKDYVAMGVQNFHRHHKISIVEEIHPTYENTLALAYYKHLQNREDLESLISIREILWKNFNAKYNSQINLKTEVFDINANLKEIIFHNNEIINIEKEELQKIIEKINRYQYDINIAKKYKNSIRKRKLEKIIK